MAEAELGELKNTEFWFDKEDTPEEEEHNRKVFNRSTELENQEYEELWRILKGQNHDEFKEIYDKLSDEEKSELNQVLESLRTAHKEQEMDKLESEMTRLNDVWSKISTKLYSQTSEPQEPVQAQPDVQDVNFEEVK